MKRTKKKPGPKSQCTKTVLEQVEKLALLGFRDKDYAEFFEVSIKTIEYWKRNRPKFREAIKKGSIVADSKVSESLYKSAIGYSHPDTQFFQVRGTIVSKQVIKHYPPNVVAAIKWLSIRQRDKWAETIQHNHTGTIQHKVEDLSDFSENELNALYKLGMKTANASKN